MAGATSENLMQQAAAILRSRISIEDQIDRLLAIGADYEWIIKTIFDFTSPDQGK